MNHEQVQEKADELNAGQVRFEYRVAQNTGRSFEVGTVYHDGHEDLFCKRHSCSTDDEFYLCNAWARMDAAK